MSIYTTQLRWIVERIQYQTHSDPDDYSKCYTALGLDRYPIFDESHRATLNDKIIRHYYFREIGFETAAQFAFFVRRHMDEHMPYFNKLYESELLEFDPLTNRAYGWTEEHELTQGGSTTTEDTHEGTKTVETSETVDDDLTHGKTNTTATTYGKAGTDTTTFGKQVDATDETTFGKTVDTTTESDYGRTSKTTNSGSDEVTEGGTHERVIHSDTPQNQISNSGVESLNYASDVTYTDREGNKSGVTEYGGITDVEYGGTDTTESGSTEGGTQKNERSTTDSGTETVAHSTSGTDRVVSTDGGKDERDVTRTGTSEDTETSSTTSSTSRDLDESGSRTHTVGGYDGVSPSDLLTKWRETFLNIDLQVIQSLDILFMGLWQ